LVFQPNIITLVMLESRELRRKLESKRKGSSGRLEKIHIEEFRGLYSSTSVLRKMKSRQIICVTNMWKILFENMKARDDLEDSCASGKIILN
jgi:hypothetical protein